VAPQEFGHIVLTQGGGAGQLVVKRYTDVSAISDWNVILETLSSTSGQQGGVAGGDGFTGGTTSFNAGEMVALGGHGGAGCDNNANIINLPSSYNSNSWGLGSAKHPSAYFHPELANRANVLAETAQRWYGDFNRVVEATGSIMQPSMDRGYWRGFGGPAIHNISPDNGATFGFSSGTGACFYKYYKKITT
jgi:hypothetical protein